MNIPKLIKDNYKIAKSKGFYPDDSPLEEHLMGIIEELGEMNSANRDGNFCKESELSIFIQALDNNDLGTVNMIYKNGLGKSLEFEFADVFIRMLNLCGHTVDPSNYDVIQKIFNKTNYMPIAEDSTFSTWIFSWQSYHLSKIRRSLIMGWVPASLIAEGLKKLFLYCKHLNIDIEKYVIAKMKFNMTREHLHGKNY